jgi:predicted Fe-Mo cluster-binding NifX family protein
MARTKVAIPIHGNCIAPCFEVAKRFLFGKIENRQLVSRSILSCTSCEAYRRVRLLQVHEIDVLLCNGINRTYRSMLEGSGIQVIPNVSFSPDAALRKFARGDIAVAANLRPHYGAVPKVPLEALICWARDLFETNGYSVADGPGGDSFLVDLIAAKPCPVCGRAVRIAVCCGAHTYNIEKEIQEFHRLSMHDYNARVLIAPAERAIVSLCGEYGIEVIDPDLSEFEKKPLQAAFPLLSTPVQGHEKAYAGAGLHAPPGNEKSDEITP